MADRNRSSTTLAGEGDHEVVEGATPTTGVCFRPLHPPSGGPPPPLRTGEDRSGFTLIELLVALAVFSLAAMALLNLAGENTRTAARVETRALAAIVAENRAIEALINPAPPTPGADQGNETLAGRDWAWTRTVSATAQSGIVRIDVAVTEDGATAATLTVFRGV